MDEPMLVVGRTRLALTLLAIACVAALGVPRRAQAATAAPPALQQALDRLVADGVLGAIALDARKERSGARHPASPTCRRRSRSAPAAAFTSARALFTGRLLDPDEQRELETTVPTGTGVDYGQGVFKLQTHNGGTPDASSVSLTSPDGSRQAVMMVTRSEIAWPGQLSNDYVGAMLTAFCGEAIPPPAARALAATMAGMLP